jgi:hypothetical protein
MGSFLAFASFKKIHALSPGQVTFRGIWPGSRLALQLPLYRVTFCEQKVLVPITESLRRGPVIYSFLAAAGNLGSAALAIK